MRSRMNYQTEISFRAWLFQIARNLIIDLRRKKSLPVVRNWVDGNPVHAWADQALAAKQESLQFERALVSLPPPQRETFLLREHAQLSLEEIARLTGVTAEVAKSRLRYALNKLRAALSV
jgi:RNA polymerase sigma-70 factor (ECF subfamily)